MPLRRPDGGQPGRGWLSTPRVSADTEAKPTPPVHVAIEWAIQDSNLGPLPYQRSALTN
jgi:hypothetical protein